MESNKILGADILDILFEGRNKEYGAYELRKTYNKRLGRAMAVMSSVVLLMFLSGFVGRHGEKKIKARMEVSDPVLLSAPETPPPPPPPPPKPPVPQVKTMIVTPPRIVPDDKVDVPPPTIDEIEKVKIGTVNTPDGANDDGITAPVGDGDKHVVEAPKKQAEDDGVVLNVQIESTYPGGIEAWRRFLGKNLRYPEQAANDGVGGQILVRFVVDKDGNVSDVEILSGPDQGGLREEAIRVIRKSGKWIPGVQNGRNVKSYKLQPVTFVPATDQ
jgi:protein TonB